MRKPVSANLVCGYISFPFAELEVPESWDNVRHFTDWWFAAKCPSVFPVAVRSYRVDDATSITLFRHGQFQVELYILDPEPIVRLHEHPGVEVITVITPETPENYQVSDPEKWVPVTRTLRDGQEHGVMSGNVLGSPRSVGLMLAFQHWKCGVPPTTVASRWRGKTAGPLHEALIREHNPGAFVIDGYADITRTADYLEQLK